MSDIPHKQCTGTCKRTLPATKEFFVVSKRGLFGLSAKCKDCMREQQIKSRAQIKAHDKAYYQENREARLKKASEYRASHRLELREKAAIYYHDNAEKVKKYRASPNGRDSIRKNTARRRAQKRDNGATFTTVELKAVITAHTDKNGHLHCALCGKIIEGDYHVDHWIPLKHGGTNEAGNLRITHPKCNLKKAAKLPQEIGRLI